MLAEERASAVDAPWRLWMERYLIKHKPPERLRAFALRVQAMVQAAQVKTSPHPRAASRGLFYPQPFYKSYGQRAGLIMEQTAAMLNAINAEVEESKHVLERLGNDLAGLQDVLGPKLVDHVKAIRESRMTVVREVHASLAALKDVQQFFMGKDYAEEMRRIRDFVAVCHEIEILKASGVLDAVCDAAVALAVKRDEADTP